jgi:hypothetical protein
MREAYFIRLTTEKDAYLKPMGDEYIVGKGLVGAAIFDFKNADTLLKSVKEKNLEMVHVKDVIDFKNTR